MHPTPPAISYCCHRRRDLGDGEEIRLLFQTWQTNKSIVIDVARPERINNTGNDGRITDRTSRILSSAHRAAKAGSAFRAAKVQIGFSCPQKTSSSPPPREQPKQYIAAVTYCESACASAHDQNAPDLLHTDHRGSPHCNSQYVIGKIDGASGSQKAAAEKTPPWWWCENHHHTPYPLCCQCCLLFNLQLISWHCKQRVVFVTIVVVRYIAACFAAKICYFLRVVVFDDSRWVERKKDSRLFFETLLFCAVLPVSCCRCRCDTVAIHLLMAGILRTGVTQHMGSGLTTMNTPSRSVSC